MHRKHDVQAFSKHRQKHRRAMFLSEHRLNIPLLRNGKHPIVKNIGSLRKVKIPPALVVTVFKICSDVLRCSQMFSDDHRCFWIFSRYSIDALLMFIDVLRMFAGFFQDVFRMLRWVLWAWWNLMIISNESKDFNDPKEFDDPQLFDDPSYLMIPVIR